MSQLIVTSRYLKNGNQKNKTKRRNYTKYIATRETVEIRSQKFVDRNAAKRVNKRNETIYNKKAEVLCGKSCADPPYPVWVPALYHRHIEGYRFHISQERSLSL